MRKLLFIFLCFLSCQDEISLKFPIESQRLVVEGGIEPNMPPYVILSKNQGYFDEINVNTYNDLFIYDAEVVVWTINENGIADSIFLQPLPPPFDSIPIFTDISYILSLTNPPYANANGYNFSRENKTYNLIVRWNNQEITSQTTIPTPTPLDCLWVEKNEFTDKDYEFDIRAIYDDPAEIQNNILLKYRKPVHWKVDTVNWVLEDNSDDLMELIDAGTDILINGTRFETYFPQKGDGNFPQFPYNSDRYKTYEVNGISDSIFIPHDEVIIKFCQIDEPSLKFWRSLVRQFGSNGNPFQEPLNLVSNINGGYGGWTGYGSVYYRVPIIDGFSTNSPLPTDSIEITDVF